MSKINNEDLNEKKTEDTKLSAEEMEQVTGGAAYIKFDGIDGESRAKFDGVDGEARVGISSKLVNKIDALSADAKRLGR